MIVENFCCPVCKGKLNGSGATVDCLSCGRAYEIVDGIPDFFVGDMDRDFVEDPNRTWLEPKIVEARDTIYRLCTRELKGMAFCMEQIGRKSQPNGRILEVGMGTGHFTRWIREAFGQRIQIFAFDFSWPIIEKAKANTAGLDNITIFRANARGPLPFPNERFDTLFLRLVPLGPSGTPNVQAGYQLLKPGGWYFEAGWEQAYYETPPTDWAMQHSFEQAEHHVWRYCRLQTAEERRAWTVEREYLSEMGKKSVSILEVEDTENSDGSVLKMTTENLLIARRP
jgi:SAM-dependent methyltransferase